MNTESVPSSVVIKLAVSLVVLRRIVHHLISSIPSPTHLIVRAHLVRELHRLDGDFAPKPAVIEEHPAVDVDVGERVHEAENSLGRARRPRQAWHIIFEVVVGQPLS